MKALERTEAIVWQKEGVHGRRINRFPLTIAKEITGASAGTTAKGVYNEM